MPHHRMTPAVVVPLVLAAAVGLTACSSASGAAPTLSAPVPVASGIKFDGVLVSGPPGQKPVVLMDDTTQDTTELLTQDIWAGTGALASATSKVTVHYLARGTKSKRTFDSSWIRGTAFSYDPSTLAFKAFTAGVPGMKVGGRRVVIVPGSQAFGSTPPTGSGLGANETAVYVIDLVSIP